MITHVDQDHILGVLAMLKDAGRPEEVSDIVVFLASERGRHITGTGIDITAGQSATWGA